MTSSSDTDLVTVVEARSAPGFAIPARPRGLGPGNGWAPKGAASAIGVKVADVVAILDGRGTPTHRQDLALILA